MAAFVLSQQKLMFRKFLSRYFVITMYVSGGLIPTYILMINLSLNGTFWVYVLPWAVSVFLLILIKTYIQELPFELQEAAIVDGANDFQVFIRVILPLCIPVLSAVFLFNFVWQWNAFQDTLFYNSGEKSLHTIQYVLATILQRRVTDPRQMLGSSGGATVMPGTSIRMAMTVVAVIPVSLVYPFLQRYFMKGLLIGAIKG